VASQDRGGRVGRISTLASPISVSVRSSPPCAASHSRPYLAILLPCRYLTAASPAVAAHRLPAPPPTAVRRLTSTCSSLAATSQRPAAVRRHARPVPRLRTSLARSPPSPLTRERRPPVEEGSRRGGQRIQGLTQSMGGRRRAVGRGARGIFFVAGRDDHVRNVFLWEVVFIRFI
jgi:hypothetical protein